MLACIVGFGVLGAGIGILAAFLAVEMGVVSSLSDWNDALAFLFMCMLVFGILGAALGWYVGDKIIRSKFK